MRRTSFGLLFALVLAACGFVDFDADPRGLDAITVLDVMPNGEYLGAINGRGAVAIWELATKRRARVPNRDIPGISDPLIATVSGFGFRGNTGEVLVECLPDTVCSVDLRTGEEEELFDYESAQDRIHLIAVSSDGVRMALGTLAGRILTFDASSHRLEVRKVRDEWTVGGPLAIYTLEGSDDLSVFISATTETGMANEEIVESLGELHLEEGFMQFEKRREALWLGPVVWRFEGGDPDARIVGLADVTRADLSPRADRLAICQEGGPRLIMDFPSLEKTSDLRLLGHRIVSGCGAIRFLDAEGDWVGIIADGEAQMELCHRSPEGSWSCTDRFRLRRRPGSGARPLIALPARGWFFVGLAEGGVDWYELDTRGRGSARFLRNLSWGD